MKKIIISLLLLTCILTLNSCKKKISGCTDSAATNYNSKANDDDGSCTYPPTYTIGESYGGGIIFYIDGTKEHGLVCAPIDQSSGALWAVSNSPTTGATGSEVGTGQANTTTIVNAQGTQYTYAAGICDALVLSGYSDWYLPSLQELILMNTNLRMQNIGGFATGNYWSSTEYSKYEAWLQYFGSTSYGASLKTNQNRVRAIRSF